MDYIPTRSELLFYVVAMSIVSGLILTVLYLCFSLYIVNVLSFIGFCVIYVSLLTIVNGLLISKF